MAKDHFQDIVPATRRAKAPPEPDESYEMEDDADRSERSIRNISAPKRRLPDRLPPPTSKRRVRNGGWLLWVIAVVALLFLGAIILVAFRSTTVTVTPRSHEVVFDQQSRFTALPSGAPGTLSYTAKPLELEDSEVVSSSGTVHAEDRASGAITVFNSYSAEPVTLIKNTRFESANGLIYRTPADIVVPGKKGTTPGQVRVTVVADAAGEQYNVAAGKFTVPGLKSTPDMYKGVYAQSDAAMSGGFVGDKPGVSQSELDNAIAKMRSRLEQKARQGAVAEVESGAIAFPDLVQITYEHLPDTTEANGSVRLHERAHVLIPVIAADMFASEVARMVAADADQASVRIVPKNGFAATAAASSTTLGTDPLSFALSGSAELIWNIDESALRQALAGKEKAAFQSIATSFPGIEEARARIEPFWSNSFPANPDDIKVKIEDPAE